MEAAQDQQAFDDARQLVLDEVELLHPIVFDTYNLCDMYKEKKLCKLTVRMLKTVSSHFDPTPKTAASRRKASYLSAIEHCANSVMSLLRWRKMKAHLQVKKKHSFCPHVM